MFAFAFLCARVTMIQTNPISNGDLIMHFLRTLIMPDRASSKETRGRICACVR